MQTVVVFTPGGTRLNDWQPTGSIAAGHLVRAPHLKKHHKPRLADDSSIPAI